MLTNQIGLSDLKSDKEVKGQLVLKSDFDENPPNFDQNLCVIL